MKYDMKSESGAVNDYTDRLPQKFVTRNFDIFFFSAASYLVDIGTGVIAAYIYYYEQRLIPIIWYVEAILAAIKFRMFKKKNEKLSSYAAVVQAERDFLELFLESTQVLVQGVALAHTSYFFGCTKYFSKMERLLLSSCWLFVIHHRSLRVSPRDKENMTSIGILMQLLWRVLIVFSICVLSSSNQVSVLNAGFLYSTFHVIYYTYFILQLFETGSNRNLVETGLIVICAAVRFFALYNMA